MDDNGYMQLALNEATDAYSNGQVPIGAVLTIDNFVVDKGSSSQETHKDWFHHAELSLIGRNAPKIRVAVKKGLKVVMYSTLEPCLQCMGSLVHNRFTKVVYGSPDPAAGAATIEPPTKWYERKWPEVHGGILEEECYSLFVSYMKENKERWKNILPLFEKMGED